jgi:hypothetical protein
MYISSDPFWATPIEMWSRDAMQRYRNVFMELGWGLAIVGGLEKENFI